MSYLLDALRKAEKERNLGRVPDLGLQADDIATGRGKSLPAWALAAVGALVVINLLVLVGFWWSAGQQTPPPAPAVKVRAAAATATPEVSRAAKPDDAPVPADTVQKASEINQPPAVEKISKEPADEFNSGENFGASDDSARFNDDDPPVASAEENIPEYRALPPRQRAQIPELQVNGHLYSSIPGRSFVLINGRRYHEGQRLAEGPAVVLIDQAGAIFKYGDIRFRLDAPR